jgi:hypothetical protein
MQQKQRVRLHLKAVLDLQMSSWQASEVKRTKELDSLRVEVVCTITNDGPRYPQFLPCVSLLRHQRSTEICLNLYPHRRLSIRNGPPHGYFSL